MSCRVGFEHIKCVWIIDFWLKQLLAYYFLNRWMIYLKYGNQTSFQVSWLIWFFLSPNILCLFNGQLSRFYSLFTFNWILRIRFRSFDVLMVLNENWWVISVRWLSKKPFLSISFKFSLNSEENPNSDQEFKKNHEN